MVKRMFKWAASEELIPPAKYQALAMVSGLQKGRTSTPEIDPVLPVDDAVVDAILPFLNRHVRGWSSLNGSPVASRAWRAACGCETSPRAVRHRNPIVDAWSWWKYGGLANLTRADIHALDAVMIDRRIELKFNPVLITSIWERSQLPLPKADLT